MIRKVSIFIALLITLVGNSQKGVSFGAAYANASYHQANADPIVAIGNLEHWWHEEDIPGTSNGDPVTSWVDRIASYTLTTYVAAPTLNTTGGRAVQFNDTGGLGAAEVATVDFAAGNAFTIVVQIGPDVGTNGSLVAKTENGASPIHYQLQSNNMNVHGLVGTNINRSATVGEFGGWSSTGTQTPGTPFSDGDVISMCVGDASSTDVQVYANTTAFSIYQGTTFIGDYSGDEDFRIGCRGDGAGGVGFPYDGSLRHVLVFSKKLSASEVATIVANLFFPWIVFRIKFNTNIV